MTTVLLHEGSAAPKLEPPPRPQVRAVRGGNHGLNRVRHVMRTAVIVLILAVSGGLAISSLMSGATLMELNAQVDEVSAQLAEAQSEYDYLNTRMNDITSRASLQQVAEGSPTSSWRTRASLSGTPVPRAACWMRCARQR